MLRHSSRIRIGLAFRHAAAVVVLLVIGERPASAYIDIPLPSLARLCQDTPAIAVLRVEKVNRAKMAIVYRKVRDLKGSFPTQGKYFGDTFTHALREPLTPFVPGQPPDHARRIRYEMQHAAILAWAAEGNIAVIFQRGGEQAICVGPAWYHARPALVIGSDRPPATEAWVYSGAGAPELARFFSGDVEELVDAVTKLLAKRPATIPRMVGTIGMVSDRVGPIRRVPADYDDALERKSHRDMVKEFRDPFLGQSAWSTHRGNAQRTGAVEEPGPKAPKVLWAHKSEDHFIAALVPGGKDVYASSFGAFNSPNLQALALDPEGARQVRWYKGAPLLRQPIAAAPALLGGQWLVFGDGFNTAEGSSLRCLRAADGFPLWQLTVPGKLVHFEGTPTIAGDERTCRLYVGGGNAGVLCLDPNRLTLEGKEKDLALVQRALEDRWKELRSYYEVEKKKDPEFALPPDESQLPRPTPKRVWQKGQERWHVDAPVALVEECVLAASAYLDDEKEGERALVCLKASDGEVLWKIPLKLNPWAGPTVGSYILVACSSIRLDPKAIPGAKGEVVAVELDSGKVRWRNEVPGGVLSSVAVRAGLAIFTATDGKVRAWDAFTGQEKWSYDAKAPFFAGSAVAKDMVYAADLKGVVHALNLVDGKKEWTLDLGTDPATHSPGMVHGAPIVHRGRLYLATCNLGERAAPAQNLVVCIGDK
jgi:outer membrane protein assembly factor BamB